MPVILATQETEIRRIVVRSHEVKRLYLEKNPSQKRAGVVFQHVGP
jgi:hypothetical protein